MLDMWEHIQNMIVITIGSIVIFAVLGSVGWALLAALGIVPDFPDNPGAGFPGNDFGW